MSNNKWTEENQKAEFLGGAIAGGCAIAFITLVVIFVILAYVVCGSGC